MVLACGFLTSPLPTRNCLLTTPSTLVSSTLHLVSHRDIVPARELREEAALCLAALVSRKIQDLALVSERGGRGVAGESSVL